VTRWYRPAMVGMTAVVVAAFVPLAIARWFAFAESGNLAFDLYAIQAFAQRYVDSGSMYLPSQLEGPFNPQPYWLPSDELPSMYPPHAIFLFAPFLVLPAPLWWMVPLGVIAFALWRLRPAPWAWPILAIIALSLESVSGIYAGSTTMWLVAFVAGGLMWGWPAVLVTIKPSLLPFAFIGMKGQSWWVAAVVLGVSPILMLGQWFAYVTVVSNAQTSLLYSLGSVPAMMLPVVAWAASCRRRPTNRPGPGVGGPLSVGEGAATGHGRQVSCGDDNSSGKGPPR